MNTQNTDLKARMTKAFELVCPATHAAKLAAFGMISGADAASVSWKGRIAAVLTQDDLTQAGVTLAEVIDSIEFFTATSPVVTEEKIFQTAFVRYVGEPMSGWLVLADGYAVGPAR